MRHMRIERLRRRWNKRHHSYEITINPLNVGATGSVILTAGSAGLQIGNFHC